MSRGIVKKFYLFIFSVASSTFIMVVTEIFKNLKVVDFIATRLKRRIR